MRDIDIMRLVVEATRFTPRYETVLAAMEEMGDQGIGDMPLDRSPFGKLVHEYMGFEQAVYALYEDEGYIRDFLAFQEQKDLELVRLAAAGPAPIVILSDHADENLISPRQYAQYCIPYYRKIVEILHDGGKLVSTHLDGNFKGFFPLLDQTGFDLLDGCTPAPMFNYEVEELAAALTAGHEERIAACRPRCSANACRSGRSLSSPIGSPRRWMGGACSTSATFCRRTATSNRSSPSANTCGDTSGNCAVASVFSVAVGEASLSCNATDSCSVAIVRYTALCS